MGKQTINVLKPFMFSHPPAYGERLTTETRFSVGEHEVDESVANHPWIRAGADGKVETAAQAKVRADKAAKKAEQDRIDADIALAAADAAVNRLRAGEPTRTASREEIDAELNTPIDQLRAKRGQGMPAALKSNETPAGQETLANKKEEPAAAPAAPNQEKKAEEVAPAPKAAAAKK